jgi:D-psicose/D-tagatose/L-ribulose 3-epimerase
MSGALGRNVRKGSKSVKFGVNTFIWTAECNRQVLDLFPVAKEHGFDGMEVPLFRVAGFPSGEIRRAAEQNAMECTICSVLPGELSIICEDPGVRLKTRQHLMDCVRATADAGAGIIAGPLYSPVGYLPGRRRTTDEWKRAVDCYQALCPVLAECCVQMAVEPLNRFETYFLNTVADAVSLCADTNHPNVGILFDTFHANIEEKSIGAACLAAGVHLKHVHTCENDRGTPGTGHIEWQELFRALGELHYDGWLTIESFGFALGGLSAAASIWRDLAPTPESIAFDGVEFLKQSSVQLVEH